MSLTVFVFEEQEVRFVGTPDKPEWIAQDVCRCLELNNVSMAINGSPKTGNMGLDEDEKGVIMIDDTFGTQQQMLTVTEPGLYRLIFKSRKPVAKRFQRWVFHDVLPTIRKTGGYSVKPVPRTQEINPHDLALIRIGLTSVNPALVDGLILNEMGKLKPELKPALDEAHKLLAATTEIPEVLLTPTAIGNELGISSRKVNLLLIDLGLQEKNPIKLQPKASKTLPDYVPTEEGKVYAGITMATGNDADNTTYQHLKWKQSILKILQDNI